MAAMLSPAPAPRLSLLCLHGYGLRGGFWQVFAQEARLRGHLVEHPDLAMHDAASVEAEARRHIDELVRNCPEESGLRPLVLGHSLGGIFAALACRGLQDAPCLAILSAPFGSKGASGSLPAPVRWLLRWRLVPGWVLRRRFFGRHIPVRAQKALFAAKVQENPEIRSLIQAGEWFHTHSFQHPLAVPGIAIACAGDRIVAPTETAAFARAVGLPFHLLAGQRLPGHDDIAVSPSLARQVLDLLEFSVQLQA